MYNLLIGHCSMEYLPDLVILKIFKYLEYKDLVNVACVCSRIRRLSSEEFLWKKQCQVVWLINSIDYQNAVTWKDTFKLFHKRYSKYIDCYEKVKSSWNALEEYLSKCCPEIYSTLNPGIEEDTLIEFENLRQVVLPSDYKLSYMIHNGQCSGLPLEFGVFGGLFLPHENYCNSGLCPFETAIKSFSYQCHYSLPITITQSLKLAISQLVLPKDRSNKFISHNTELIAYRQGQYCSIFASFSDWFSEYVEKLCNGHYVICEGNILLYDKDTEVSETTKYITVTVRWSYSHTTINSYTYHITMSMAEDAPISESCKLMTRHWEIDDENGSSYVVDGDGVVGFYPIMKPGSKFNWRSYTSFHTDGGGSMKGHFTMCYLSNPGLLINVACPKFTMKRPLVEPPTWTESHQFPLQRLN